jgi:hypothetical protein
VIRTACSVVTIAVLSIVGPLVAAIPAVAGHDPGRTPPVASTPRPTPTEALLPAPSPVHVIGDSLTVGTIVYGSPSYLRSAMGHAHLTLAAAPSARVGRRVDEGLALLTGVPQGRRTVLIALGTNDIGASARTAASWIRRAREVLGPEAEIFWVNLQLTGPRFHNQTRVNAGLLAGARDDNARQVASGSVGRTHVLDWYSYARDHGVANRPDGIHYCPANYRVRATFYAESLAADSHFLRYRLG